MNNGNIIPEGPVIRRFDNIAGLMEKGKPVSIIFSAEHGKETHLLYCELIQKARNGESFLITNQRCRVCEYVLGNIETAPLEYYYRSGRYKTMEATTNAVSSLNRLERNGCSIRITPYSGEKFDILILYLKPELAMRIIQAHAYTGGKPVDIKTGGIASICSDCTAYPYSGKLGLSLGCKGSRKHSKYGDDEVVVGIPFKLAQEIDEALGIIPKTFS